MAKKPVKYYVVDAFVGSAFRGNPAAVCLVEEERDEKWLQDVAAEFNMPVTCYLTKVTPTSSCSCPRFCLRWFSPVVEVDICGHATLATSHTLFSSNLVSSNTIEFVTLSGTLTAEKLEEPENAQECFTIELDFPSRPTVDHNFSDDNVSVSRALNGLCITDIRKTTTKDHDIIVVLSSAEDVIECKPRFDEIEKCSGRGLIVTAIAPSGSDFDFYSRFFFPKLGVLEDAVCGSAHCALAPYWSEKLGKLDFTAYAASRRGGIVKLRVDRLRERVKLQGTAVTIMEGSILV